MDAYRRVPVLDPNDRVASRASSPLISVIVPAHNEEDVIRACMESVIRQDYTNFELIVVNDRSRDRTAEIVCKTADGHDNIRALTVEDLPPDWTGKCHALSVAVKHARGEWIAFLDADSILHESALSLTYQTAVEKQVSMVTLTPKLVLRNFWDKALQPTFAGMCAILHPLGKINDPSSKVASANGMFFLINRDAYDRIGGHYDVRNLAVEDIGIGKRVKASNLGLVFANGSKVLATRMYTSLPGIIMGWTRILSASMNYEIGTVCRQFLTHAMISLPVLTVALAVYIPHAMVLWPTWWMVLPIVQLAELVMLSHCYCPLVGVPRKYSGLMIIGNMFLVGVLGLIIKKILWRDALQWRGTTYVASLYQPKSLEPAATDTCSSRPPLLSLKINSD